MPVCYGYIYNLNLYLIFDIQYQSITNQSRPSRAHTHEQRDVTHGVSHTSTGLKLKHPSPAPPELGLSQDILVLRGYCARINNPFTPPAHLLHCPPWCNTIARLLGSIRLPLRTPVRMLYIVQYW